MFDLPTEFSGSKQTPIHPSVGISLADYQPLLHQCARFSESPKKSHAEAVKRIGQHLLATRDKGLILHPSKDWHFDCWVDADFACNWHQVDAHTDPMTSKSRSGWVVQFAGVPITWASKMQTIMKEFRQQLQVQSHLEMPGILVQLGHIQHTKKLAPQIDLKW